MRSSLRPAMSVSARDVAADLVAFAERRPRKRRDEIEGIEHGIWRYIEK